MSFSHWLDEHWTDEKEGNSLLGRQGLSVAKVWVPVCLELGDGKLLWSLFDPHDEDRVFREAESRGALAAFVRIEDAKGVLRFACRYGVLGICKHGLPAEHNPPPAHLHSASPAYDSPSHGCVPLLLHPEVNYDPIDCWLHFVRQARALLSITVAMREGKAGSLTDWETVYEDIPRRKQRAEAAAQSLNMSRRYLYRAVNDWLTLGNVRLRLAGYGAEAQTFQLGALTFGVLAVQLLLAVTQTHAWALCDGCKLLYPREERAPKSGQRNFCPECRGTVAACVRKRSWRTDPKNREAERRRQRERRAKKP